MSSQLSTRSSTPDRQVNLVVLRGEVTAQPTRRDLPAGGSVVSFDVTSPAGPVPVAWHDPLEREATTLSAGIEVVIIGAVRRRFFRHGGVTQSRTEVVADRVLPARRAKSVRSAVAAAAAVLDSTG